MSILRERFDQVIPGVYVGNVKDLYEEKGDDLFADMNEAFNLFRTGFMNENGGEIVRDVKPIKESGGEVSSHGHREIPFHTEAPHTLDPPTWFSLYCVNKGQGVPLQMISTIELESKLRPKDLIELEKEQFEITAGPSWKESGQSFKISVRRFPGHWAYHSGNMKLSGLTNMIHEAMARCKVYKITLETGMMALISNGGILHGRSRFIPTYDENDRHMKRVYYRRLI